MEIELEEKSVEELEREIDAILELFGRVPIEASHE